MHANGSCTVTPDNGAYMVAAYAVTAIVLVTYAVLLFRAARRHRNRDG